MKSSRKKYVLTEEKDDSEDVEEELIKVIDNDIYFHSPVYDSSILELIYAINTLSKKLQIISIKYNIDPPPIKLHINSEGGSVIAALSLLDKIKNSNVEIHSIIEGCACSAATIISIVCHKRFITKDSYMLIHNISSDFWGKMHEIEDEMKNLKLLTKKLKDIYKDNSIIQTKQLDSLLKKDLLIDANTCKRYGFVDEII